MSHALERTSPKGQDFVGKCIKCGQAGLTMSGALLPCPKDDEVSDQDALLKLLDDDL